ncbi:MAG TPA: hypothetical protein PKH77_12085 [Anaerolineae bacterium]|nr:hypothetical protein [Anaerolineae bacterium]
MNSHSDTVTYRLSQEELLLILRGLGAERLTGLGDSPLGPVDKDTEMRLLDAAGRALFARGLIAADEKGHLGLDRGMSAAVSACVYPAQMVSVAHRRANGDIEQRYFYRVPELAVAHSFPMNGIHDLELGVTSDMGSAIVRELLMGLPENERSTPPYPLKQAALAQAHKLADQGDGDAVTESLTSAGIAADHARWLAGALAAPALRLVIQLIYRLSPTLEQKVFTLIGNGAGCWLVEADQLEANEVVVQGLSAKQALDTILAAYRPLIAPLAVEQPSQIRQASQKNP